MIQIQEFDSRIFGRKVARLEGPSDLRPDQWRAAGLWLVSVRLPEENPALLDYGFRKIETLITYRCKTKICPQATVRRIAPHHRNACMDIAARAFTQDRYHADRRIPKKSAGQLKAEWILNAPLVLIVRDGPSCRGFVSIILGDTARVDLIAVDPDFERLGFGHKLVMGALDYCHMMGIWNMDVSTQETNRSSRALYERCGFLKIGRAYTYHWINQ